MRRHLLIAAFFLGVGSPDLGGRRDAAMAFGVVAPPSRRRGRHHRRCMTSSSSSSRGGLFATDDADDDDVDIDGVETIGDATDEDEDEDEDDGPPELALLLPGQRLRVRIGDVSNSRKAWKKRRRNASPILVPCSVLGVDRENMVRRNVVTLLHAIGEEMTSATSTAADGGRPFLGATAGKIGRAYRKRLGGDLRRHASALGHGSVESLIGSLFVEGGGGGGDGVRTFVEPRHGNLVLRTSDSSYPSTKHQARGLSSSAGMVRFRRPAAAAAAEGGGMMVHTGAASVRAASSVGPGRMPTFADVPLGAALRVEASAHVRLAMGDELDAFVYDYDAGGDDGCPLLVLTPLDESRRADRRGGGGGGGRAPPAAVAAAASPDGEFWRDWDDAFADAGEDGAGGGRSNPGSGGGGGGGAVLRKLEELKVGDGPFDATVVAVSARSGAAFVDVGVGRKRGKKYGGIGGGGVVGVLGMLRFEDVVAGEGGGDDDDDDDDDSEDDAVSYADEDLEDDDDSDDAVVEAGDEIRVYIKAVSTQSGRFMVTLDPNVGDKKARDRKIERQAEKRKGRLLSKRRGVGGRGDVDDDDNHDDDDDRDIRSLVGNVYDGVVKAKSKTGNWYYVQPTRVDGAVGEGAEGGASSLPVGIANFPAHVEGGEIRHASYSAGDRVRVRLEGIDERRGQLALTLLD